eukprot:6287659-Amphidinium_carterae.2
MVPWRATSGQRSHLTDALTSITDHSATEDSHQARRAWLTFAKDEFQQGSKKSFGWLRQKNKCPEPAVGLIPQGHLSHYDCFSPVVAIVRGACHAPG